MSRLKFHLDTLTQECFIHNSSEACMLLQRLRSYSRVTELLSFAWLLLIDLSWLNYNLTNMKHLLVLSASNMYHMKLGLC